MRGLNKTFLLMDTRISARHVHAWHILRKNLKVDMSYYLYLGDVRFLSITGM